MSPLLSFFGFYKSFFFTRKHPFSARLQEFGFSLCHAKSTQLLTHWSRKHTACRSEILLFPLPPPSSVCPAPFPAYRRSFSSVTCFPGITATDDTNDSPGFAILLRGFCAQLDHGRGQRSNRLRESFMKICCKPRVLTPAPCENWTKPLENQCQNQPDLHKKMKNCCRVFYYCLSGCCFSALS